MKFHRLVSGVVIFYPSRLLHERHIFDIMGIRIKKKGKDYGLRVLTL